MTCSSKSRCASAWRIVAPCTRPTRTGPGWLLVSTVNKPGGPDQDVVDVPATEARVVDHMPFVVGQLREQAAHVLLRARAAVAPLDERHHEARDHEHADQQSDLGDQKAPVVQAEQSGLARLSRRRARRA